MFVLGRFLSNRGRNLSRESGALRSCVRLRSLVKLIWSDIWNLCTRVKVSSVLVVDRLSLGKILC